jgi:hypothetical protein
MKNELNKEMQNEQTRECDPSDYTITPMEQDNATATAIGMWHIYRISIMFSVHVRGKGYPLTSSSLLSIRPY